ncbi:MAG: DUF58 domain-containing protein [Clostridia bacterium]|jgi:uncharacterized protein (DUF58 family)|nr:DUF58 domain-containing protein [Clostridia bacterium]
MHFRRILYLIALAAVAAFHLAFGQYVSHFMLWFVLLLPVVSLLLSLPAILMTKIALIGPDDVQRGREGCIRLTASCKFFLPLDCLLIRIEEQNLFTEETPNRRSVRIDNLTEKEKRIRVSTEQLGNIRCAVRSAWAFDYLGFFAFPIRKPNAVAFTVLPSPAAPVPDPILIDASEQVSKPKPQGYSEEHELRPYRAGDSINLIHWKLTSKFDDPIIREPQEMLRKHIILAIDLPDSYAAQENLLDQLRYLSDALLAEQIPFGLYLGLRSTTIRSDGELIAALKLFLSEPMHAEATETIRSGNDTLIYRLVPNRGVDV